MGTSLGAITVWIFSNTLIAGVIALCALAADRMGKRPSLAHLLWVLVLIKLLTPPIVSFPIAVDPSSLSWLSQSAVLDQLTSSHRPVGAIADTADDKRLSRLHTAWAAPVSRASLEAPSAAHLLGCTWALGTLAMLVWVLRAARRVNRLIERRGRFDIAATRQLSALATPSDVIPPPVWLVDAVVSPMLVTPLLRRSGRESRIAFPKSLWLRLDENSRAALLLHELEHWRRRDSLVRFIEVVGLVMLWWHPLVWIAKRQIEECEERCCDFAASSQSRVSPREYAEAILTTLDFLSEPLDWGRCEVEPRPIASGVGRLPLMEQRLRHIMTPSGQRQPGMTSWIVVIAMVTVIPLCPSIVIQRAAEQAAEAPLGKPKVLQVNDDLPAEIVSRYGK